MTLHHIIQAPKVVQEKNPVILLIHGYGSNEEDLFSFASELPNTHYIISLRAPYDLQPYGYAWYAIHFDADENKFSDIPQAKTSRDAITQFIKELPQQYAIDTENVSLIGFSQGAILSYAIALSHPQIVKNVVALSGYLNLDLVDVAAHNALSHLNFYISHGTADQIIPIEWAEKAPAILANFGLSAHYKTFPIGHGVSPQNFYDFKSWLTSII